MLFPKQYVSAGSAYAKMYQPIPAPYIYKNFFIDADVLSGDMIIGTPGFYRLWINGHEITRGHMAPYIANPDKNVYFDVYDITPYLRKRDNVIGILLGNGMQNNWGGFPWYFQEAPWRGAPKVAFRATVTLADGKIITAESDLDCLWHESPIQWDDERMGEYYDARFEVPGWNCFGDCPRSWMPVTLAPAPKGTPRLNTATAIKPDYEIKPVEIIPVDDGFIYDFGVNFTGITRLKINGTRGQTVEILHGEYLHDGKFYGKNLYFANKESFGMPNYVQKLIYVCAGAREEIYQPSFCYFGMRYAKVTGITKEQATPDLLTFIVMHSDLGCASAFNCSDNTLNSLYDMSIRSDLSNFWYFPTDCPHREKNGWTGDAALSCEQFYLHFHPEKDLGQWLDNIISSIRDDGVIPGIVPTNNWGYDCGPCWDWILVLIPYYHYRYTGDLSYAVRATDAIMKQLRYFRSRADKDGLIHNGLSDWCSPEHPKMKCNSDFLRTGTAYAAAKRAAYLFAQLKDTKNEKEANEIADFLRQSVRSHFINAETGLLNFPGQTGPAFALQYGITNPEEEQAFIKDLLQKIDANDNHMDVGIMGLRAIFHVLSRFGYTEKALKLILEPTAPSYAAWVNDGMTTLCESPWGPQEKDEHGNWCISSLNHHFMGDISHWFISALGGIHCNPAVNDANVFSVEPHITDTLTTVHASHRFPAGLLTVDWKRDGNKATVTVSADKGLRGTFAPVDGWKLEDGKTNVTVAEGVTVYHLTK